MSDGAAFFVPGPGGSLVPDPSAHSPWGENMLHGRLVAALAARAVEAAAGPFTPVRVTVDLFRAVSLDPVEVSTEVVRDGGRLRLVQVAIRCGGRQAALATGLMLRSGSQPSGQVWSPDPWSVSAPDATAPMTAEGRERAFLDIRLLTEGGIDAVGQKRLWIREVRSLVAGEENSPFVRAVAAADLANPFGNFGDQGLFFINADLTVHLARLPAGEWVGMEIASRASSHGVATVVANLYDPEGLIGSCSVASVATGAFGGPSDSAT